MATEEKSNRPNGRVINFDHLTFWVSNAKQAASFYVTRLGFKSLASKIDMKGTQSHAVQLNKIILVFQSPLRPSSPADDVTWTEISRHGDFLKDTAFEVKDLAELVRCAREAGASIVRDVYEEEDDYGIARMAVVQTYGDNTHTLVDRSEYKGSFLPGYEPSPDDVLNDILPDTGLKYIDHVEANLGDGDLDSTAAWYEKSLNFNRFWCVDFETDWSPYSNLVSKAVINDDNNVLLSLNEARAGQLPRSKVDAYVENHGSAGIEHIALYTDDIFKTVQDLKSRGASLLTWPPAYYTVLRSRLVSSPLRSELEALLDQLEQHQVLIDYDENGYMLQTFTAHLQDRPTLFIELLQRKNHKGFGAGNYQMIFEALELGKNK